MESAIREGDWMQTFTGRQFWPHDPRPGDFSLRDIAHSLSYQCRYNGHCTRFYSVAQHSIHVSELLETRMCDPRHRMWGLMHDAAEAYVGDMIRPIKRSMPEFCAMEDAILYAIEMQYALGPMPRTVHDADNAMLAAEMEQIMATTLAPWTLPEPAPPGFVIPHLGDPDHVAALWLKRFGVLAKACGID